MSTGARSVIGYLVMPRPGDAVKWAILPVAFGLAAVTSGTFTSEAVGRAVVVWAVLELLVYPARYQVNDMLGFDADQRHPDGDRGRLPGPAASKRSRIATSGVVAAVKVVAALSVAIIASGDVGRVLLLVMSAVLATALAYELLRARATGRTGQVPAPATPGVVAIWLVVGAGYAVRGLTGAALAVDLHADPLLFPAVLTTWWAFGVGWVTSRWAVESTAYAHVESNRLVWHARPEDAREHLLALVRWLPEQMTAKGAEVGLRTWRPTEAGTAITAPWHLAGVVAGAFAALTGLLLTGDAPSGGALAVTVAVGAAATGAVSLSGARRPLVVGLCVVALLVLGPPGVATISAWWLLPWATLSAAQAVYLRQDRDSMGRGVHAVGDRVRRVVSAAAS